jgi:copper oxidase (laccase) domain-containing protein
LLSLSPLVSRDAKAIRFPGWLPVSVVFSTTEAGNMSVAYEVEEDALRNRAEFLNLIGFEKDDVVLMRPEHGKRIVEVGEMHKGFPLSCDGLVTKERGLPLVFLPGDCFPLIFGSLNPLNHFIGLFHVGLKGALEGIVREAVRFVNKRMRIREDDLIAALGPGIYPCCYRGWELVKKAGVRNWRFVNPLTLSFDLPSLIKKELNEEGVRWILDLNLCTSCTTWQRFTGVEDADYVFFSHRRSMVTGEKEGRFMVVAWLG